MRSAHVDLGAGSLANEPGEPVPDEAVDPGPYTPASTLEVVAALSVAQKPVADLIVFDMPGVEYGSVLDAAIQSLRWLAEGLVEGGAT